MIHRTRNARTDHRIWNGTHDPALTEWLGPDTHHWHHGQLILHTPDGDMTPRPGWSILRWDDGELTIASPRIVARVWQMEGRCSAVMLNQPHAPHEWTPQPTMPTVYCPGTKGN